MCIRDRRVGARERVVELLQPHGELAGIGVVAAHLLRLELVKQPRGGGRPGSFGMARNLPLFPLLPARGVEAGSQRLQLRLPLLPDPVSYTHLDVYKRQQEAVADPGRELTYIAAISEALREEMRRDPNVLVMGEDIAGDFGGAFKVTKGFEAEFGARRVLNTPLAELGLSLIHI